MNISLDWRKDRGPTDKLVGPSLQAFGDRASAKESLEKASEPTDTAQLLLLLCSETIRVGMTGQGTRHDARK